MTVPTGRCDPSAPWGKPSFVKELSGGAQRLKPTLCVTKDELEIYYLRNDGGGVDGMPTLRHGKRSSLDGTWTVATESAPDPPPADLASIVNDGTKLYYYVKISGVNVMHVSERKGKDFSFTTGVPVTIANDATTMGFVVETDDFIYFGDGSDIRRAFVSSGGFSYNGELALRGHSQIPILNSDQTNLYFREDTGASTKILRAHRADTNAEFNRASAAVTYLGLSDVRWISNDDCQMYLSGDDETQVYEVRRGN